MRTGKCLSLLCFAAALATLRAADWPQWRGPSRDGHAPESGVIIQSLPEEPKVVWKVKAGPGLASPIVCGDWVIQFDAADKQETVRGLDRGTGAERWRQPVDKTFHDMQGPDGPRCTPVTV